jgi:hypothetical protein
MSNDYMDRLVKAGLAVRKPIEVSVPQVNRQGKKIKAEKEAEIKLRKVQEIQDANIKQSTSLIVPNGLLERLIKPLGRAEKLVLEMQRSQLGLAGKIYDIEVAIKEDTAKLEQMKKDAIAELHTCGLYSKDCEFKFIDRGDKYVNYGFTATITGGWTMTDYVVPETKER